MHNSEVVSVEQGQLLVAKGNERFIAVLGTCVAVCLRDSLSGVCGITHFLLPVWSRGEPVSPRFGDIAVPELIERMLDAGGTLQTLQASVVGGMDSPIAVPEAGTHVGAANVGVALRALEGYAVAIASVSIGGAAGRRLVFSAGTGTVKVT